MNPSKWHGRIKVAAHYCVSHPERTDATRCLNTCRQWLCVDCHASHDCQAIGGGHRGAMPWTGRDFESSRPRTVSQRRDDVYRTSQDKH